MGVLISVILLNVMLLVFFELFKRYNVHQFSAIVFNYITTVIVGTIVLGRFPINRQTFHEAYFPYGIVLGFLFIFGFNLLAKTVESFGVTLSSIAQKMSLITPILFGLIVFSEQVSSMKWAGIACAIIAIILINYPDKKDIHLSTNISKKWYLIILTFVVSGIIDVMLYFVEKSNMSKEADIGFLVTLFGMAAIIGSVMLVIAWITGKAKLSLKDVLFGLMLGVPNFFSIYLLLVLINKGFNSHVIFPILNMSIIAISAIVGSLLFKEKLGKLQWVGFGVGLLCILFIVLSV